MIAILAPRLFDGETFLADRIVTIGSGRITGVAAPGRLPNGVALTRLPPGSLLAPGFIDLQVNGGGGVMFNDRIDAAALRAIAAAHAGAGTTAILPTLISGTRPQLRAALAAAREALAMGVPGIAGLHLEGPFLAPSRRGIHPLAAMTAPTEEDIALLCEAFPAPLMVTLAPDVVRPEIVARLNQAGVIVFAGHTDASYEHVAAGVAAGISGFTHLYNAMSQFVGRQPGAVGAALDHRHAYAGIIVDLHHVHPASVRLAAREKGADRLFLVSDAMATAASDATGFVLNGEAIRLVDGRLVNAAGTLAGAHLTMAEAVRLTVQKVGLPLGDVLRMATATPAAAAGLERRGRVAEGYAADLVWLDEGLGVAGVWQGGRRLSLA